MNKIKSASRLVLFALPILIVFAGCSKFLDRKPLTATLDDLNQGGVEGQVYGIYGAIRNGDIAGQAFGGIPWLAMNNFRSDDSEKGSSASDGADWGVIFDEFQYAKDHWAPTIYWDQHYVLIGRANTALQQADSLGIDDEQTRINVGEAKFFRAFAYFDLVRAFGEVPKIDFRVYNPEDSKIPKSSVDEIYALIDQDLADARMVLPLKSQWPAQFEGRLTKGAAEALTAKTMLYRKDWAGALGMAESVINSGEYALMEDYRKIWLEEGENGIESIFEIQASIGANGTDNYSAPNAVHQGVRGAGEWDLGWGWNTPTQAIVDAFEAGDKRKNASILFSGQNDDYGKKVPDFPAVVPRKFWNKKVYPEPAMQTYTANRQGGWINQRVLRFADVLLMAAEAANELPGDGPGDANTEKALGYLKLVRERAGLTAITTTNEAELRTAIQHERRVEMALEGDRFYDLVRWGLAPQVLGPLGYQQKHRYYPIPQAAIDFANGALIQNPDY